MIEPLELAGLPVQTAGELVSPHGRGLASTIET
jgi:hypothetical protein